MHITMLNKAEQHQFMLDGWICSLLETGFELAWGGNGTWWYEAGQNRFPGLRARPFGLPKIAKGPRPFLILGGGLTLYFILAGHETPVWVVFRTGVSHSTLAQGVRIKWLIQTGSLSLHDRHWEQVHQHQLRRWWLRCRLHDCRHRCQGDHCRVEPSTRDDQTVHFHNGPAHR